jgi:hypothetical protein
MDRRSALIVAFALAIALVAAAPPGLPGDGGEYLAYALNFADFKASGSTRFSPSRPCG